MFVTVVWVSRHSQIAVKSGRRQTLHTKTLTQIEAKMVGTELQVNTKHIPNVRHPRSLAILKTPRGELSYLAPLGSENISAPYFKQCFFRGGGGYYPPD